MAYLTQRQLKSALRSKATNLQERKFAASRTIFLSHAHKDQELVHDLISVLGSQGVNVYVDWLDVTMPQRTSSETARLLKDKMKELDKFLLLVTEASSNSRWVPWELGIADGVKGVSNLAMVPICEDVYDSGNWAGQEFFGLYPKVETTSGAGVHGFNNPELQVCQSNGQRLSFRQWLNS